MTAVVTDLWRYGVKGLDRDVLDSVDLVPGAGFPKDRAWALQYADAEDEFVAAAPAALDRTNENDPDQVKEGGASRWVHKSNFLSAYTAPRLLEGLETEFDAAGRPDDTLVVRPRGDGSGRELLVARLSDAKGRADAEAFFGEACGRPVRLVGGDGAGGHHFGNTPAGFRHHRSGSVIHLVNAATVEVLGDAAGASWSASRFRPNVVVRGAPAWSEFEWVGKTVALGGARLEAISRTVRCEATNFDPWRADADGGADDVPGTIATNFPAHGPYLGIYLRVVQGGTVRAGDALVVPSAAPHGFGLAASPAKVVGAAAVALVIASHKWGGS